MKTSCPTPNLLTQHVRKMFGLFVTLILTSVLFEAQAQCPLACNDQIQVSVDINCTAEITPDMVLEAPGAQCNYIVVLYDENGVQLPDDTVRYEHVGTTVKARVTLGANSCWSLIKVEDKTPPVVRCARPQFFMCNQDSYVVAPDIVIENCVDYTEVVLSDKFIDYPCDSAYSGVREICRYYVDAWGNISDTCCHQIFFYRPELYEIDMPEDTVFSCDNFPGADPTITGVPTWNGLPLYPDRGYCELNISYTDDTIDICPASYKIIREWLVYDWCLPSSQGNPRLEFQVIKVVDEDGPVVYCPTNDRHRDTISSDVWTCTGTYILPVPIRLDSATQKITDSSAIYVIFDCSETTYSVKHLPADKPGNCVPGPGFPNQDNVHFDKRINRWVATDLPHGCNWFYYTFTDECGNYTECSFDIFVADDVPPVAVCDEHTIVSLGIDGYAKVYATSLDDGSWDNCAIDRMMARRMDWGQPCGHNDSLYAEYVEFCCEDEGKTRMVEFVVWDEAGNSNTCMVEVEVQDKMPPIVTCPPHITVSCDYDLTDLSVFGTIVNAKFNQTRKAIVIDDPYVQFSGPAIDGEYYDNCVATFRVEEVNNVECGNGEVRRTFIVTDKNGRESSCTQVITVVDYSPFEMDEDDWPDDYNNTTDCIDALDLDPSVTGEPRIDNEDCGNVFVGYNDQVFNIEPDACVKILREWKVIDWCYYDPNSTRPRGIWTHTQVIKILNNVAPTFISSCADRTFDLFGADCTEDIEIISVAEDDCTAEGDLRWRWDLDIDDDGVADTSGTSNRFFMNLGPGLYHIWWTVADQCDNESFCHYSFEVIDKKKPTPYCRTGINTVLMQTSETVTVWASDFNIASEDNCTAKEDLVFAFLINGSFVSSMTFDCNDLGLQTINMYVIDEAGNYDYCETTIDIQDPNDICGTGNLRVNVGGVLSTNDGVGIDNVNMSLVKLGNNVTKTTTTDVNGAFVFSGVNKHSSYRVKAERNDDPLNGVSTKDLVLIQRYLLGKQPFADPYQYIAADANNSEDVTASDIAEIRKLILGVTANFRKGQTSWRFVNADATFNDPNHPFPFEEYMEYYDLNDHQMASNFVGVKIGDLDRSAKANARQNVTRQGGELNLTIDDGRYERGDWIEVPVYAEAGQWLGMQMTINLEKEGLELQDIISGQLEICEQCYMVNDGKISMSWFDINTYDVRDDAPAFILVFKANDNGKLSESISLTSDVTSAEAYADEYDLSSLKLNFRGGEKLEGFELYQNVPNPFSATTAIGFELARAQDVKLSIFDVTGKVHQVLEGHFDRGYHEFIIDGEKLNVEGVLYYQLTAGSQSSTRKMLMLR